MRTVQLVRLSTDGGHGGRRAQQRRASRARRSSLDDDVTDARLAAASAHLAGQLHRVTPSAGVAEPLPSGDAVGRPPLRRRARRRAQPVAATSTCTSAARRRWRRRSTPSTSSRDVLRTLEQQFVVVSLVRDIVDRGLSVAIGVEHGVEPLSACSVVVAPVVVDGEQLGSVGVLGPTRMNYPQALATVEVVSDRSAADSERADASVADYYELLGVSPLGAAPTSSRRRTASKARELHPDANPDDRAAAERFKEVAQAYEVLSDADQRARYDRFGEAGVGGAAGGPQRRRHLRRRRPRRPVRGVLRRRQNPFGGGGRRGPAGPPRGQDLEVVADITFEQAVFGATDPGHAEAPAALRRLRRLGRRRRHAAGDVRRVQRPRSGAAGAPEPARPDGHQRPVPALRRPRPGHRHAVPDVPRRGPDHRRPDLPGRRAGRCRHRLDAAARRAAARPARAAAAAGDLYVHLRVAAHERYWRDGNDLVTDGADLDRPGRARHHGRAADARRRRGARRAGRHPAGQGVHAPRARRAPAAGPRPRRPARPARRRGADQARRRRAGAAAPARREARRVGRTRPRRACSRASSRRSRRRRRWTRRCAARPPTSSSPTSPRPALDDADDPPPRAGCCACATARRSRSPTAPARGVRAAGAVARLEPTTATVVDGPPRPAGHGRRRAPEGRSPRVAGARRCTEVGVDRIVLLDAERSVVRWDADRAERQLDRLRRVAAEAAMQSRRVWLPERERADRRPSTILADAVASPSRAGGPSTPHDTTIAVGPEGGWSPAELDAAGDRGVARRHRAARRDGRRRRRGADDEPAMSGPRRSACTCTCRSARAGATTARSPRGPTARHLVGDYLEAVARRHRQRRSTPRSRAADGDVFVGGGTPTLVPPASCWPRVLADDPDRTRRRGDGGVQSRRRHR